MARVPELFDVPSADLSSMETVLQSQISFVRSEGQLALFDESRGSTGRKISAWEALDTYGSAVLNEALDYGSAILKSKGKSARSELTKSREALGVSHRSLAGAARVKESEVSDAESGTRKVPVATLEKIAFSLGLDERLFVFDSRPANNKDLLYRLRMLQQNTKSRSQEAAISPGVALLLCEAASIIRTQARMQSWLDLENNVSDVSVFSSVGDYGSSQRPAWRVGYDLARLAREKLGLSDSPIESLRDLVETQLRIPVIQAKLPTQISGATVVTRNVNGPDLRGIVLNTVGENENVWVRRATLAHELGHLLFDPDERLNHLTIDTYEQNQADPQSESDTPSDFIEQRANAFAIAFLAPIDKIRDIAQGIPGQVEIPRTAIELVMRSYGISWTAACYHAVNVNHRQYDAPAQGRVAGPDENWQVAENFTSDYFPIRNARTQRSGRFAGLVAECYSRRFISEETGAQYLGCSEEEFHKNVENLRALFPLS